MIDYDNLADLSLQNTRGSGVARALATWADRRVCYSSPSQHKKCNTPRKNEKKCCSLQRKKKSVRIAPSALFLLHTGWR